MHLVMCMYVGTFTRHTIALFLKMYDGLLYAK